MGNHGGIPPGWLGIVGAMPRRPANRVCPDCHRPFVGDTRPETQRCEPCGVRYAHEFLYLQHLMRGLSRSRVLYLTACLEVEREQGERSGGRLNHQTARPG